MLLGPLRTLGRTLTTSTPRAQPQQIAFKDQAQDLQPVLERELELVLELEPTLEQELGP